MVFRVFADGVGFRYELPRQPSLAYFTVQDEPTEFNLPADHKAFWIPGDYDSNEYAYTTSRLSEVNTTPIEAHSAEGAAPTAVQTPLMLKSDDGLYINIHEAALVNYPAMMLNVDTAHLRPQQPARCPMPPARAPRPICRRPSTRPGAPWW